MWVSNSVGRRAALCHCLVALVGVSACHVGAAGERHSEPIWVENLSPLTGLLGLPPQRSATLPEGWQIDTHLAIASHFVVDSAADESVFLDGETTRFSLAMEYGWHPAWSARLTVPWVAHDAGFLDGVINSWHDFFGMSDGGRSLYPEDAFRYALDTPEAQFDFTDGDEGVGDIRLELNHGFYRVPGQAASISLGFKLPTGDEDAFTGSGAGDLFTTVRFSGEQLSTLPLTWHAQGGYLWAGSSDRLGPGQEREFWFAGIAADWRFAQRWSLLAQYDSHAAPLDSALDGLGEASGLLSFGLRFYPDRNWSIEASFVEDIIVESAPDITFQASLRWHPVTR